ncbi:phage antirepressor N-terminal domain-containing protein [uncultured Duncaniella sp.]|jgi:hypothetical protein|uniref:phage antirepressor N-terminal domain-containing protein n=1 Tax=uncultured Duncaniella sp. TaxID=2768039 RepID=UPI0025A9EE78|nr:phage antirepressor N-terminal domain-containing protein [uncultured Duncaniella sp.]
MKQKFITFNGVSIPVATKDSQSYLPIKPICEAIGIAFQPQNDKIKEHPILRSTVTIIVTVGADGKPREMVCLPVKFIYGWLFTINPGKVAPEARAKVEAYSLECYEVLYNHFNTTLTRQLDANAAELEQLKALNDAIHREKEAKADRFKAEKALANIRASRLEEEPTLF